MLTLNVAEQLPELPQTAVSGGVLTATQSPSSVATVSAQGTLFRDTRVLYVKATVCDRKIMTVASPRVTAKRGEVLLREGGGSGVEANAETTALRATEVFSTAAPRLQFALGGGESRDSDAFVLAVGSALAHADCGKGRGRED